MDKTFTLDHHRDLIDNKATIALIGAFFFILATALGAYIRIPIKSSPVPITLQTFFVILSGAVLGKRLGSFSQFAYIALGAFGIPLFQGFSFGLTYLMGPTSGYLIGFFFSAYVVGRMLKSDAPGIVRIAVSFITGNLIIYTFGVIWLVAVYRLNVAHAVQIGILPFIPGDALKVFAAALIYSKISRRARSLFRN